MLPLEHVLLALKLVLNCTFLPSAYFVGCDTKSNVKFTVVYIAGIVLRTLTTTLCSVLFMRAQGRSLSQVLGKAAFLLKNCGVLVYRHYTFYN